MGRLEDKTAFISGAAGSIAFANAGIFGDVATVEDYDEAVFERVLAVNVLGPFHVAKHALRATRPGSCACRSTSLAQTSPEISA